MRVADRRNMFSGSKCVANHREEQSAGQTKMLWITLALIAAACTSLTVIFAKIGIKYVNSDFATFYRTGIVVVFSLILCAISGTLNAASSLTAENFVFLGLSGIATGCSWLCYYKAIKLGDVNKVAPVDKSSFVLSSLLFLIFFFDETTKNGDPLTLCVLLLSVALTLLGTLLMIAPQNAVRKHTNGSERKALPEGNGVNRADGTNFTGENLAEGAPVEEAKGEKRWLFYAVDSSVFAAVVPVFIKFGMRDVPSSLGTLLRTIVVFIFSGAIVAGRKEYRGIGAVSGKSWLFLSLSGIATGGAWLCEYAALGMNGVNPVAVNSAGKLSVLLTMLFSFLVLKEKFTKRTLLGLLLLVAGVVLVIAFSL